jgi:broad specificity phosphatase PhoE
MPIHKPKYHLRLNLNNEVNRTTLLLIRHGETSWNIEGRYQGQADPPLNDKGLLQAQELVEKLASIAIDILYTSPLRRAMQTAQIIAHQRQIPCITEPRLMEIHQGDWQTRLRSEIESLYPEIFRQWEQQPWQVTPPGGESLSQVKKRVYAALDEIITDHAGQHIGLVTHRIPIALIKMRYQELAPDIVRTLHLPNAFYEQIAVFHEKPITP